MTLFCSPKEEEDQKGASHFYLQHTCRLLGRLDQIMVLKTPYPFVYVALDKICIQKTLPSDIERRTLRYQNYLYLLSHV